MAGRKPKFKDPAEMERMIEEYFKSCEPKPLLDEDGTVMTNKNGLPLMVGGRPPTVTGLALALGFNSRQSLINYQGRSAFMDTITRAKSRIEQYCEERLFDKEGHKGAEFSLSYNFKWVAEKSDDEEKTGGGVIEIPAVDPLPQPPAELVEAARLEDEKSG